jgi:hypothetical protein
LKRSVSRLASTAIYARDQAACTRRLHLLHLDLEEGAYWITSVASSRAPHEKQSEQEKASLQGTLPRGIWFVDVELPGEQELPEDVIRLRFSPEGWADSAAIHVAGPDDEVHTLRISGAMARIETYDCRVNMKTNSVK